MTDFTELERLLATATPGPWKADQHGLGVFPAASGPIIAALMNKSGAFTNHEANAALIVAAVNALQRLLEIARAAQKALPVFEEAVGYVDVPTFSPSMAVECNDALAALRSALHPQPQKEQP